jgi:hypothetical protein
MDPRCMSVRTQRHGRIQANLMQLLRRVFGNAAVSLAPAFPDGKRADIRLQPPGAASPTFIDVSITSPTTHKALHRHSYDSADVAACLRQTAKHAYYGASLAAQGLQDSALVAFVAESTGRFGPEARSFFNSFTTAAGRRTDVDIEGAVKYFKRHMMGQIMASNSECFRRTGNESVPNTLNQQQV